MLINITAKGVTLPASLRELAERKLGKLERLLRKIDSVDITCSHERNWQVVEVMINANGLLIRGQDRSADFRSALENLVDKLERRIKKSRSKLIERYREAPETREAWAEALAEEEPAAESSRPGAAVVRSKRFPLKPMTPEEAVEEMELLGHDFFVFTNAETNEVNVIYRRKAGNYGLIEPEF
jgi:putative sigma-54 modulation protein